MKWSARRNTRSIARYLAAASLLMLGVAAGSLEQPTRVAQANAGPGLGVTISGARGRVSRSKPVKLKSHIRWRGPKADMTYSWETLKGPALPYGIDRSNPSLTIPPADLQSGDYKLRLRVRADWEDPEMEPASQSVEATSDVTFRVNSPPFGGSCSLSHKLHGPNMAQLSIRANDWQDADDKRLQYRYSVERNGKRRVLQNWRALKQHSAGIAAKSGDRIAVICEVRDRLGDVVEAKSGTFVRE